MINASGIYYIRDKATNRLYVGSAVNLRMRWNTHRRQLRLNIHHSKFLQRVWNARGQENIEFAVIELVENKSDLIEREQVWLDELTPEFNTCKVAGSLLGVIHPPNAKTRLTPAMRGRKHSEETRRLYSETRRGRKQPPHFAEKVSAALKGFKHTDQARANMSAAHRGQIPSPLSGINGALVTAKTYTVITPEGAEITLHNLRAFCRTNDLKFPGMLNMIKGRRQQYKGWTVLV